MFGIFTVFLEHGIRVVVREVPIWSKKEWYKCDISLLTECFDKCSCRPISSIAYDPHATKILHSEEAIDMLDPVREDISLFECSLFQCIGRPRCDDLLKVCTCSFKIYGFTTMAYRLHTIVFLRIVTCSDHDSDIDVTIVTRRE